MMRKHRKKVKWKALVPFFTCTFLLSVLSPASLPSTASAAATASLGSPARGHLENGIPFPGQFKGYTLRDESHTYTTPEVVGTLLDALENLQKKYPDTCPAYFGDFTIGGGGRAARHKSHQNGRDVDIGYFQRGNVALDTFKPMNAENLDAPKTWALCEMLLRSGRVQYVFMDRSIQRLLYSYALTQGWDRQTLDVLFANTQGAVFQHVRGHRNHMHVRFYTPWSTLAGALRGADPHKMAVIELAQQAFLPKKVHYEIQGSEQGIDALARSFGVTREELLRWNGVHATTALAPGSSLVFYKRGFETEPVNLAQTLQPALASGHQPLQLAATFDALPNITLRGESPGGEAPASVLRDDDDTAPAKAAPTLRGGSRQGGLTLAALSRQRSASGASSKAALKGSDKKNAKKTKVAKGKTAKHSSGAVAKAKTRSGGHHAVKKTQPAGKTASKAAARKAPAGKKPEKATQAAAKKPATSSSKPSSSPKKAASADSTASPGGKVLPRGTVVAQAERNI